MARQSNENIVRVEVTLHKEKYSDVIQAMEEFGSQAGFLKFAARQYIKSQRLQTEELPVEEPVLQQQEEKTPAVEPPAILKEEAPKKRRPPAGFGQSHSRTFEE